MQSDFHSAQASVLLWVVENWRVRINSKNQGEPQGVVLAVRGGRVMRPHWLVSRFGKWDYLQPARSGRGLIGIYRVQAIRTVQNGVPWAQQLRIHLTHYTCLVIMSFSSYLPQEDTIISGLAKLVEKWPSEGGSFHIKMQSTWLHQKLFFFFFQ